MSPSAKAPSEGFTCRVETVTALMPAKSLTSESISAPASATLVASVTSAEDSIVANLALSAPVIIAPEPTSVTSDNAVTLDVV